MEKRTEFQVQIRLPKFSVKVYKNWKGAVIVVLRCADKITLVQKPKSMGSFFNLNMPNLLISELGAGDSEGLNGSVTQNS